MPDAPQTPPKPPEPAPVVYGVIGRAINQLEERVEARLDLFHQELALLRGGGFIQGAPPPGESPTEADTEAPPPSKRVKAMRITGKAASWLGIATLVLTLAAALAAQLKPGLVGPIQNLLDIVKGLGG